MPLRFKSPLFGASTALALLLVLAACTPGGQFDPTELFNSDVFDSKTKLKGQRVPVFPDGVPGTATGVPADLVKGYKPPPDQPENDANLAGMPPPGASAQPEQKPKPKPKPRVAVARQPKPRALTAPPSSTPTRIDVGATGTPAQQPSAANWPNSPPAAQQTGQFAWPAPPGGGSAPAAQPAQPAQSSSSANAPAAQGGRTFDSMWPNPPATGTQSQ